MQIIIDLHAGKPAEEQNIQTLLEELLKTGYSTQEEQDPKAKLIVVDTDTKRFYFLNSYFPVVYGFIDKEARPISIENALANWNALFLKRDNTLLLSLYKKQFAEFQAKADISIA